MSILKKRSKEVLIYSITESKISNIFSALIIFLGSLGLLLVAISSYLGMDLFLFSEEISNFPFIPQGATMAFYGIGGLFISFYLWWILLWNIGGGFDIFDKKIKKYVLFVGDFLEKIVVLFSKYL